MFKSIRYLRSGHDKTSNNILYYYHLVDDEFECEIAAMAAMAEAMASSSAAEYHKRNLPIIKNLYLFNNYILKDSYQHWSFEKLLNYQNQHIDKYCPIPGMNFSKDIYPKLLKMHEELRIFK